MKEIKNGIIIKYRRPGIGNLYRLYSCGLVEGKTALA